MDLKSFNKKKRYYMYEIETFNKSNVIMPHLAPSIIINYKDTLVIKSKIFHKIQPWVRTKLN